MFDKQTAVDEWKAHLRLNDVKVGFPRDYSTQDDQLFRDKAYDLNHYLTVSLLAVKNHRPNHVSVYSDWQIDNRICDAIMFDVEGVDILDTSLFESKFLDVLSPFNPRVVYTGGRGYHNFILIPPTRIADLRGLTNELIDAGQSASREWDGYIDKQRVGDWRTLTSVPYTFHRKTGFESQLIMLGNVTEAGRQLAECYKTDKIFVYPKIEPVDGNKVIPTGELTEVNAFPPCVEQMIVELSTTGELDHYRRIHLASFMIKAGFSNNDLHEVFKMAKDYSPSVTSYNLDYLRNRNWNPFNCKKVMEMGGCPFICKFYPSLQRRYFSS